MALYDLAVAWEWPMDAAFVERILARAARRGLTALAVTRDNLQTVLRDLAGSRLRITRILGRAVDERPEFAPLVPLAQRAGATAINDIEWQQWASDKGRNHLLCAWRGIPVPFTVIVPSFMDDPSPPHLPVALGRPFVVKPASGSGSEGMVLDASATRDVQQTRLSFWRDRYLLQQRVHPTILDGRRAWFRVFYVCGRTIPCWWDDITHVYAPLTIADGDRYGLAGLHPITLRVGEWVNLGFFSTEIMLGTDGRLACIDYANSPCDMHPQSSHHDGVPDVTIDEIVDGLLSDLRPRPETEDTWALAMQEVPR